MAKIAIVNFSISRQMVQPPTKSYSQQNDKYNRPLSFQAASEKAKMCETFVSNKSFQHFVG